MCKKIGCEMAELCKTCGGSCCTIYANYEDGGWRDQCEWWEDWVSNFHGYDGELKTQYGVAPLYDAIRVHLMLPMEDEEVAKKEINELKSKGIDINKCEYCSPTGCIIPREKRGNTCLNFMCNPMQTLINGEKFLKDKRLSHLYEKFNIPFKTQEEYDNERSELTHKDACICEEPLGSIDKEHEEFMEKMKTSRINNLGDGTLPF